MRFRGHALLWAGLPLLLLTPFLFWLGRGFQEQLLYESRSDTQLALQLYAGGLQRSLDRIQEKLQSLGLFVANQTAGDRPVDDRQFSTFAAGLHASSEWIRAFQVVTDGVITNCYPVAGNETVIGYNLMNDPRPVIGGDVIRAWKNGRPVVTGPLDLIQGGLGIIMRRPVPSPGGTHRRLVAVVLNIAPLLAESAINADSTMIRLAIRREGGDVFFGSPALFEHAPVIKRLPLADGAWIIGGEPNGGWPRPMGRSVLLFHLTGGVIILLLCLLVFELARRQEHLAEIVRQRTATLEEELQARLRMEEQLQRHLSLLEAVTEGTSDSVFVKDRNGRYRMINTAGAHSLGQAPQAIIGKTDSELLSPEAAATVAEGDRIVLDSGRIQTFEERSTAAGVARTCQSTKAPWRDEHGAIIGVVGVSRDITEAKQAEEELRLAREGLEQRVRERTAELAVAKDRAESADRLKSAFLATMSHELRTPLNSVIGFTGILLQGLAGPLNAEQTKQLGMVQGSARHLLMLINDVLDISKIEAGELKLRIEPFDLASSLERAVATVQPLADKKGLRLRLELPPSLDPVAGDVTRVEQVLLNLLNNAIKFTETGEIVTRAETVAGLEVPSHPKMEHAVRVRITDTGIGIRPEDMSTLFQPFRQIDSGLTRRHEGTGLGLAICRRLADLMGGTILVQSEWGKGSTFTFVLPTNHASHP